jgi:DNA-binding transcriptional regulator LsrR (DeoR family)
MDKLDVPPSGETAVPTSVPEPLAFDENTDQTWRARRNRMIYLVHCDGLPHQVIADAFKLSRVTVDGLITRLSASDEVTMDQPASRTRRVFMMEVPVLASAAMIRRSRRDLVIRLVHSKGFSQRSIAAVFDLPRAVVAKILKPKGGEPSAADGSGPGAGI